jgi:hypothetical protein
MKTPGLGRSTSASERPRLSAREAKSQPNHEIVFWIALA